MKWLSAATVAWLCAAVTNTACDRPGQPVNVQAIPLSPTVTFLAWDEPLHGGNASAFDYNVVYCAPHCQMTNVVGQNFTYTGLQADHSYTVYISACSKNTSWCGEAYVETFTSLANDYAPVSDIKMIEVHQSEESIMYNISWKLRNQTEQPADFDVIICSFPDICTRNTTENVSYVLSAAHFHIYNVTVEANYHLPLGIIEKRNASDKLVAPGTSPAKVTNIRVEVNSTRAQISWDAPSNVPESVTNRLYEIVDIQNGINELTTRESLLLENLIPDHLYNLSICLRVEYDDEAFEGAHVSISLKTDVAVPGVVRDLVVVQKMYTNLFNVSWSPPPANETNGPIDYYYIRIFDESGEILQSGKVTHVLVATVAIDKWRDRANFTFCINAVNVKDDGEELIGEAVLSSVQFYGIDPADGVELLRFTDASFSIQILLANQTGSHPELFYLVEVESTRRVIHSETPQVEVTGLHTFTNETLNVKVCSAATFCSKGLNATFQTDAGVPSPPRDLVVKTTSTTSAEIRWLRPEIPNGPIDQYRVDLWEASNATVKQSFFINGKAPTEVSFNDLSEDIEYNVNVTAINRDSHRTMLNSTPTSHSFFYLDPPLGVELLYRTDKAVTLNVRAAQGSTTKTDISYIVTLASTGKEIQSKIPLITIANLKPFETENVSVRACRTRNVCSSSTSATLKTNVGGPSSVQNLKAHIDGTRLTDIELSWKPPKHFNGNLDGYQIELVDMTANNRKYTFILPGHRTSMRFNSSEEYEIYEVTVVGFNVDLDDSTHRVLGYGMPKAIETIGTRPPRPYAGKQGTLEQTFIELSWDVPYSETWNVLWSRVQIVELKLDQFTQKTSTNLTGLQPYRNFTIILQGCVSDSPVNCSLPRKIYRCTDIGRPSPPRGVTVRTTSQTSAEIHWMKPEKPNGPIDKYRIDIWNSTDERTLKFSSEVEGTAPLVANFAGLNGTSEYFVSIVASNTDSRGVTLTSASGSISFKMGGGVSSWVAVPIVAAVFALIGIGAVLFNRKRLAIYERFNLVVPSSPTPDF